MITFHHPTTILIAGLTAAGKTCFSKQTLEHKLIQPSESRIICVFVNRASDVDYMKRLYPNIEYVQGRKNILYILAMIEPDERNLLVLEDQMSQAGKLEETSKHFTQRSHHGNISVVYIVQNVFEKWKVHRTISVNSHFMDLFKNPRDQCQIRTLAQLLFQTQVTYVIDYYREASNKEHGYLLGDLHPPTPHRLRIWSSVYKPEELAINAPSSGLEEQSFDLEPSGYIKCGK